MKIRFYTAAALIVFATTLHAQYTDIINSHRPGTSQGAFAVGYNVIQAEVGLTFGKDKHDLLQTESNVFSTDYTIRYGLLYERLEVNITGQYLSENVTDNSGLVPYDYKQSNFRSNTIGAKFLLYDPYKERDKEGPNLYSWRANNKFRWRELIPAVSVYGGVNLDTKDNPFLPPDDGMTYKALVSTQINMEGAFVFVTNIIADRITSEYPTYSYILTLTHAFNPRFSAFVENQGIMSDWYADQLFRFGAAYLFSPDFQVDILATTNFKDTPSKFYVSAGVSYRYDMHTDPKPKDQEQDEIDKALKKAEKEAKKKRKNKDFEDGVDEEEQNLDDEQ
ncbi:MAG TPA: transporter [Flavobacteriaceae bacterium]|nr:transporter [Flavobacteriaceae bacterium]